jgi:hypothetical protein
VGGAAGGRRPSIARGARRRRGAARGSIIDHAQYYVEYGQQLYWI